MNTATHSIDALALAAKIERLIPGDPLAAELRRLVTENQQLRADMEAIGAGGVGPLMPTTVHPHCEPLTEGQIAYAKRYAWLRSRDVDAISSGGVFAGMTPENVVLNGEDLDAAIDAAIERSHGIRGAA